jgi:Rod binding domain-containing protein
MFAADRLQEASSNIQQSTHGDTVRHTKLLHAAQQFEALMLNELLKPLGRSSAIGASEEDEEKNNVLGSFGVEAMAGALAKSGALGFANRIVHSMEDRDTKESSNKVHTVSQASQEKADNPRGGNYR